MFFCFIGIAATLFIDVVVAAVVSSNNADLTTMSEKAIKTEHRHYH